MDSKHLDNTQAKFAIGEIIHHKLFDYRGVIYNVDSSMQLSEEWYEKVARSRPPKDKPWYHILVDNQPHTTYVAEQNLETDQDKAPIQHPLIDSIFEKQDRGRYQLKANNIN